MELDETSIQRIARIAHEANRAFCESMGDYSQVPWDEADDWQRASAANGVEYLISVPEASAADLHEEWRDHKRAAGWTYGPTKDASKRTHPCIVDFAELSYEQQAKDKLFIGVVKALL